MRRKRGSKIIDFFKTLLLLMVAAGVSALLAYNTQEEFVTQAHVIDGDSIRLEKQEIRLHGIDAPEYRQICTLRTDGTQFECGKQSRRYLVDLIDGKPVTCRGWERDKYDRLLGDCSAGDKDLNAEMVLAGWAISFGSYVHEENTARENGAGLWSSEFDTPSQWREDNREKHRDGWLGRMFGW